MKVDIYLPWPNFCTSQSFTGALILKELVYAERKNGGTHKGRY